MPTTRTTPALARTTPALGRTTPALALIAALALAAPARAQNLPGDEVLSKVLPEGDGAAWQEVASGYGFTDGACADADGNFYFGDLKSGGVHRIGADGGKAEIWLPGPTKFGGLKFGPDGRLYGATHGPKRQIVAITPPTKAISVLADDVRANDLVVSRRGHVYFTDTDGGEVFLVDPAAPPARRVRSVARGLAGPNGITLTPDGGTLAVSEWRGSHVWAYRVEPSGDLSFGAPWMDLRAPIGPLGPRPDAGGDGMITDADGRFYVTSPAGVQMFDWTGRLGGVIANPVPKPTVHAAFAGPGRAWLYVCATDKIFRRKTKVTGAPLPTAAR